MDAARFLVDVELVPASLERLAVAVDATQVEWPMSGVPRRLLLTGMGSSCFAAEVCARRLRAAGIDAVAELASATATWPPSPELTVVAISAGGSSIETLQAIEPHIGVSRVLALTNTAGSALGAACDATIEMLAGVETGGVACRSFRHTIGCLLALEATLLGQPGPSDLLRRAAAATADLLDRRASWLDPVLAALDSRDGTWLLAPVERISSAMQGALMLREGPRRRADACETVDWSHVDVYLTKTLDYRAVVFTGSHHDSAAARWMVERGSTSVAVGGGFDGAGFELRFPGDDQVEVALLTEPLVAELLAATWWQQPGSVQ